MVFFKDDQEAAPRTRRVLPLLPLRDIVVFPHMVVPLFVGRPKSIAALEDAGAAGGRELLLAAQRQMALDERALVSILTEPRNALVKQYQTLFEFEDVRLRFSDGALQAMARQALARKSGARGLRAILESIMLELMYDIPSRDDVEECVVSEEVVEQGAEPLLVLKHEAESA